MDSESTISTDTTLSSSGVRHPTLYFDDGDVVLSSDSADQITTFYRVDKLYLSRQSIVFRDMFGMPMNPSPDETYDGVAWVRMPDPTEELEVLLSAIYNVASLSLKRRHPDSALRLSGALKAAKKYEVEPIRRLILDHMEADWPQNVDEWTDFQSEMLKAIEQHLGSPPPYQHGGRYIEERFPEAGSALHFALDNNCVSLLPAVSMVLATASRKAEWNDVKRSTRGMESVQLGWKRTLHFPHVRWKMLDEHDLACLARGRDSLLAVVQQMRELNVPVISGKQTCRQCSIGLLAWREREMAKLIPRGYESPDPILILTKLMDTDRPDGVCGPCWERTERAVTGMRQTIWAQLPSMFSWRTRVSN